MTTSLRFSARSVQRKTGPDGTVGFPADDFPSSWLPLLVDCSGFRVFADEVFCKKNIEKFRTSIQELCMQICYMFEPGYSSKLKFAKERNVTKGCMNEILLDDKRIMHEKTG